MRGGPRWVALLLAAPLLAACGASQPATASTPAEDEEPPTFAVALRFEDGGTDEAENPRTAVSLVRIAPDGARDLAELATEVGACYHQDAVGALIAGRCWWAGTGARYEVRREGDAIVAYRAAIDEETGTGELEEVGRLEVDRAARLEVLTPGRRSAE